MFGAFLGELGDLTFDHGGLLGWGAVGPLSAHLLEEQLVPFIQTLRGCAIALRQPRLENVQATRKRQPVDIDALLPRCLRHQRSHHEVAKRQSV